MGLPWIAVQKSVVEHPKIVELGEILGEPLALAYVVAMWCRVSEYSPDGRVSGARPRTVLERFANWRGEPGKLADALIAVRLVDEKEGALIVHDWDELQGPHIERAQQDVDRKRKYRAKLRKASRQQTVRGRSEDGPEDSPQKIRGTAVVEERRGEEKRQEEDQKLLSAAADAPEPPEVVEPPQAEPAPTPPSPKKPAPTPPEALQALWNERAAPALPRALELNSKRRRSAAARLQERAIDGPGGWGEVIARISDSAFCRGEKPGHDWRASFDWFLQPDTAAKVLEGKYDSPPEKAQAPPSRNRNPDLIVGRSTAPPPPPRPPEPDFGF